MYNYLLYPFIMLISAIAVVISSDTVIGNIGKAVNVWTFVVMAINYNRLPK